MTADYEGETHPLDRDYSVPAEPRKPTAVEYYPRLRQAGFITFAAGFAAVFLAAIIHGNSPRGGPVGTVGYSIHHVAMVIILVGGSLIILAYRLPPLRSKTGAARHRIGSVRLPGFLLLVLLNVAAFVVILVLAHWCRFIASHSLIIAIQGLMTISCALLVTIAVWHGGFMRAYAIGVLVGLMLNNFTSFAVMTGGYLLHGNRLILAAYLATVQISGLACAAYVCLLKSTGSETPAASHASIDPDA